MALQSRDTLWSEERKRLREEISLTEVRVATEEKNYRTKIEAVENEVNEIKDIKVRGLKREEDRIQFITEERESLKRQTGNPWKRTTMQKWKPWKDIRKD